MSLISLLRDCRCHKPLDHILGIWVKSAGVSVATHGRNDTGAGVPGVETTLNGFQAGNDPRRGTAEKLKIWMYCF